MFKYILKNDGFCNIQKEENGKWVHKLDVFPESEALSLVKLANSGKKTDYDFILNEERR